MTDRGARDPVEVTTVEGLFEIQNKLGMHARPAALFVKTAALYACAITVEKDGIEVSGKSIMGLLTIEGHQGAMLKITASGEDADEALRAIGELFEQKFNED
jgi:phosphocarrier protein